jgi:hypothetical protein
MRVARAAPDSGRQVASAAHKRTRDSESNQAGAAEPPLRVAATPHPRPILGRPTPDIWLGESLRQTNIRGTIGTRSSPARNPAGSLAAAADQPGVALWDELGCHTGIERRPRRVAKCLPIASVMPAGKRPPLSLS